MTEPAENSEPSDSQKRTSRRITAKSIVAVAGSLIGLGMFALLGYQFWQVRNLQTRVANAEWDIAVQSKVAEAENQISLDVGIIQFLRRGFSIELQSVKYEADGLRLTGFVGNPLNLSLSNLTLKFTATKQIYEYRDEFRKDPFSFFFGPATVGEAQSSPILFLPPRGREPFEVTIPNVKQTKEGVRVLVTFTGERYTYGY